MVPPTALARCPPSDAATKQRQAIFLSTDTTNLPSLAQPETNHELLGLCDRQLLHR